MQLIKRILSIFKEPKEPKEPEQRSLHYYRTYWAPFIFFADEVNKSVYEEYPGLLQTILVLGVLRHTPPNGLIVLEKEHLDAVQNYCDILGILLIGVPVGCKP
jgi:hypothetical protein